VVHALGAVLAVLGAAAGLDAEQGAHLHGIGIEVRAVHRVGAVQQVVEGQREQGQDLVPGPVMALIMLPRSSCIAAKRDERPLTVCISTAPGVVIDGSGCNMGMPIIGQRAATVNRDGPRW
jgi:hypothetical protein